MNRSFVPSGRALCAGLPAILLVALFALSGWAQDKSKDAAKDQTKISEAEQKAIEKINSASGTQAKMQAVGEYLKKYGKSPMRPRVAAYVADEITRVEDHGQRIQLASAYASAFNQPGEAELVKPALIDSLTKTNKFDEAFSEGAKYLEKQPNDLVILTQLAIIGTDQAQRQNGKFIPQVQQYSARAIELIESGKKPEKMSEETFAEYKTRWLPNLYQVQGLVAYITGDKAGGRAKLEKSASLNAQDPFTLMMLGNFADDEYQEIAKQYQVEKAGPGKDAMLKQAYAKMDQVIDYMARAAAAAEGRPEYAELQKQVTQNLEAYYKYRNNGSTAGMKELIEKHKKK